MSILHDLKKICGRYEHCYNGCELDKMECCFSEIPPHSFDIDKIEAAVKVELEKIENEKTD